VRIPRLESYCKDTHDVFDASVEQIADWMEMTAAGVLDAGYELAIAAGEKVVPWDEWRRYKTRLLNHRYKLFVIHPTYATAKRRPDVRFGYDRGEFPTVFLSVDYDQPGSPIGEGAFAEFSIGLARSSGAHFGLAGPVREAVESTWLTEDENRLGAVGMPADVYRTLARGVRWGMWLTHGHLEQLGGRGRVVRAAPVAIAREFADGVWLQATASPWDVTADHISRLRSFLEPILMTRERLDRLLPPPAPVQEPEGGWPPDVPAGVHPIIDIRIANVDWREIRLRIPRVPPDRLGRLGSGLPQLIQDEFSAVDSQFVGLDASTAVIRVVSEEFDRSSLVEFVRRVTYRLCKFMLLRDRAILEFK
jgi:hypothetical protein